MKRFRLKTLLLASLSCSSVRWFLIAYFPENVAIIVFAQLLHAITFGLHHAVAIQLIHHFFRGSHQGRGQAIYSSLSFGVGGALGSIWSGYIWEGIGPMEVFIFAGAASIVGYVIAWKWVQNDT